MGNSAGLLRPPDPIGTPLELDKAAPRRTANCIYPFWAGPRSILIIALPPQPDVRFAGKPAEMSALDHRLAMSRVLPAECGN